MTPDEYCEQKAPARGSTSYYSLRFLPTRQRRELLALHAFSREIEQAVHESSDPGVARMRLSWWRSELQGAFANNPQHPVTRALLPVARAHAIAEADLEAIIHGMQLDLDYNRFPDFPTLEIYCDRVSGSISAAVARILGFTQAATLEAARTLGIALHLAHVIRDAGAMARRNRIYIPLDELSRFGLDSDDIVALRQDERFERLMSFQIERAESYFARAEGMFPPADRRMQRPLLIVAAINRALLQEIATLRGRTLSQRVALTPLRKFWIAWKTWITQS